MESESVNRRMRSIATHLAPNQDVISATHLLPMNCSASFNSVIRRRCDNRMHFARQASASQAYFMRQISTQQQQQQQQQGAASSPRVRPSPPNYASEPPVFSRPAAQPSQGDYRLHKCDRPIFSKPNPIHTSHSKEKPFPHPKAISSSKSNGSEWSPRIDVAESNRSYVMTVEVPGVRIGDIRVEVDHQFLTVTGHRSTNDSKMGGSNAYHKREISHGPYCVSWKLPTNVNRETVSAEFVDGFLHVTIPKL